MHAHPTFFCKLPAFGLLGIAGRDAAAFIQGQATNDVMQVSESRTCLTAFCNPRGRVMALGRLLWLESHLALALPQSMLSPLRERLQTFILRAAVSLEDISAEFDGLGIAGAGAEEVLTESVLATPKSQDEACSEAGITLVRVPGDERVEVYGRSAEIGALAASLASDLPERSHEEWLRGHIAAGLPWLDSDMREAFLPQMLNLDVLGAVSFTKGCYTGQEIIARTRHLGSVKRRLRRYHADEGRCPAQGEQLYAGDERVGEVVTASADPDRGHELLAVTSLEIGTHLSADPGSAPALQLRPLPYELPTGSAS